MSKVRSMQAAFSGPQAASPNNTATPSSRALSSPSSGTTPSSLSAGSSGPFLDREALHAIQTAGSISTCLSDQATVTRLLKQLLNLLSNQDTGSSDLDSKFDLDSVEFLDQNNTFAALYHILRCALSRRVPLDRIVPEISTFKALLPHANTIASAYKSLLTMKEVQLPGAPSYPSLVRFRWRVDVIISNTSLTKVFKPTLLLEVTQSNGAITTTECPLDQFHKLRYSVSKALNRITLVENHPFFKVQ
eukprot:TRINITY_DN7702_c0_g1_i1.p1 TRINITY_DN7702_c0_g1~~TRINITY_DN7702_c0_g1_i1.p1  ORF type:complete len:247 (+),score=41.96 TRINITY_DN7702_c0_g1_i1:137-877(+)